jgi:hypothetical protein
VERLFCRSSKSEGGSETHQLRLANIMGFLEELTPFLRAIAPFRTSRANAIHFGMTTTEDIEKAVEQLAPRELARFRAWFEAFDAQQFDAAIGRDAQAGKLDAHADEAVAEHRAGRSREL